MRIAVIGAGTAGLAAAQALAARNLDFVVFEAGSGVGGNWRYDNDSGLSSSYRSLRANTSRKHTAFRCFPLPRRGPLFLHNAEMLAYLEQFADHFDLRRRIRFRTRVRSARLSDGCWEVDAGDYRERYSALMVATGANSVPRYPDLPGDFDGLKMHSHDYRTPAPFAGRDVVVIGLGSSAAELACEIQGVARSVTIAPRSGTWVVPRRLGPIPLDWLDSRSGSRIPLAVRRRVMVLLFRLAAGPLRGTGLPVPDHLPGEKPLAISDDLLSLLREGKIGVCAPVARLSGDRIVLAGGRHINADAILFGTGYRPAFDFLPPEAEPPSTERAPLYRGLLSLAQPGLFYIGIVMGQGALIPVMEAQANWAAEVIAGRLMLPDRDEMRLSVELDQAVRRRNFDARFGFIWDRLAYCRALESESRQANRHPGRRSPRAAAATVG